MGDLQERLQARVRVGGPTSVGEVLRAAMRALDREELAVIGWVRQRIDQATADPRPDGSASAVFERLRAYHAEQVKTGRHEEI